MIAVQKNFVAKVPHPFFQWWDVLDDSHTLRGHIKEGSTSCEVSIDSLGVHVVPSMEEAEALAHSLVVSAVLTF